MLRDIALGTQTRPERFTKTAHALPVANRVRFTVRREILVMPRRLQYNIARYRPTAARGPTLRASNLPHHSLQQIRS